MRCCDIDDCSHQRTGIRLGPSSYELSLSLWSEMYIVCPHHNATREACPTRKWRASVSNIGLTLEEDPLLNVGMLHNPLAAHYTDATRTWRSWTRPMLHPWHPGWAVSVTRLCVCCLCQHQVWRPQHFNKPRFTIYSNLGLVRGKPLRRADKHGRIGSIVYAFGVFDSASFWTHACCFIEHACSVLHDGNDEHCCYE